MFINKDNGKPDGRNDMGISRTTAVLTCARRACFIIREVTGLEVMPEEVFAASSDSLNILGNIWEDSEVAKKKPDSTINFAACMACMEWANSVRKSDSHESYELNKKKISDQLSEVSDIIEGLFPGLTNSKNCEKSIYDGLAATVSGIEQSGWKWTVKLNEKFAVLMSLYTIIKLQANNSVKLGEIAECLQRRPK